MNIRLDTTITKKEYEAKISQLTEALAKLPTDYLVSRNKHGGYKYYVRSHDKDGHNHERYIPLNNKKYIEQCCQAKYYRHLLKALKDEMKAIQYFEEKYNPQAKYDAWDILPKGYRQFAKKQYSPKHEILRDWEYAEFEQNTFPNGKGNQYVSKKGEAVRSRIELIVADMLFDLQIPYRYECKLKLAEGNIYPDFTIMHPETLELYYIEIFGMMDNPEYEQAALKKISKYAASDYYSHLLMFFDHKDAPISTPHIKKVLKNIFC